MKKRYDIDAKPTKYNGILYRSRLEARWAAFFDFIRFDYEYEPEPFETWSPDFVVHTLRAYVEIKPFTYWDNDLMNKISPYAKVHRCGLFHEDPKFDENYFYLGKQFNKDHESGLLLKDFTVPYIGILNQKNCAMLWAEAKNKVMYLKPNT